MDREAALRTYYIRELQALLEAIDKLLTGPGAYFDPGILPDPRLAEDFCMRYSRLRAGLGRELADSLARGLPSREFEITRGAQYPIQGCLLRQDMEVMRQDVKTCLTALDAEQV